MLLPVPLLYEPAAQLVHALAVPEVRYVPALQLAAASAHGTTTTTATDRRKKK